MKIVLAPDSFKGTMSSVEVCSIIEKAVLKNMPAAQVVKIPVADGGEGMVDAYLAGSGGSKVSATVTGPKFDKAEAFYGILPDGKTAIIEMAAASGLLLAGDPKDPMNSTSFGTGELIADAAYRGCKKIILGLGGSATMDGGIGMAAAMGVEFYDKEGNAVPPTPKGLANIENISVQNVNQACNGAEFIIAGDVKNIICGPNGAAHVFGRQKGAGEKQIRQIDGALRKYVSLIKRQFGIDLAEMPGGGAAGGLALPLLAFFNAEIVSGIDLLLDIGEFDQKIQGADMVITGEGKLDRQSMEGKVPIGVLRRAKKAGVPVVAVVGDVGEVYGQAYSEGMRAIFSTCKSAVPFEEAKKTAKEDLFFLVDSLFRFKKI
jgi:glycerate kinase